MKRGTGNLVSRLRTRRTRGAPRAGRGSARELRYEFLEDRRLLSGVPFGAFPDDTAEYMLGDVLVSVVLMESNTNLSAVNENTETWTPAHITATKQKVQQGVQWWEETLAAQFPGSAATLEFQFDFTYADQPVLTRYEPISQTSDAFQYWIYDFLNQVGHNQRGNFSDDIRSFNHAQRLAYGTDWAFTVFVVNDANDDDGMFKSGGAFPRAFSYAGGQFMISPAGRPASTFAHETGHMFWARDEYYRGGNYADRRGYYNAQNVNAWDNPTPGFVQAESIMATGSLLDLAYLDRTSSHSSLEMIGWRDSDNDGIFDVLDVPHTLRGTGFVDPASGQYRFLGESSVQALFNFNSSGLQNDITLNTISRAEFRVDSGPWESAAAFDAPAVDLDLSFAVPATGAHTVEIRTVDVVSGVVSTLFQGNTERPSSALRQGLNGFVWHDADDDGQVENEETRLPGWTVRLVDADGLPLNLVQTLDPDGYASGTVLNSVLPGVELTLEGDPFGKVLAVAAGSGKAFGSRSVSTTSSTWTPDGLALRIDFTAPVTSVRLDAIGTWTGDRARLEAFDSSGTLLGRYTTDELAEDQTETMQVQRPVADIAYVVGCAHAGFGVRLDRLQFGPETSVQTDAQGAYAITSLPAGAYFVEAVTPSGSVIAESRRQVVLAEGEALGQVDLVAQAGVTSWQNPVRATDVTGDGHVTPLDALTVINFVNAHAGNLQVPLSDVPPPYYDVDGNGFVTAADVLFVINELNASSSGLESGEALPGGGLASGDSSDSAEGEGETPHDSVAAAPAIWMTPPASDPPVDPAVAIASRPGRSTATHGRPFVYSARTAASVRTSPVELRHRGSSETGLTPLDSAVDWPALEAILDDLAGGVAGALAGDLLAG